MAKEYLTRSESAAWLTEKGLPISRRQLEKLATRDDGPEYAIFGNRAVYRIDDLREWAEARLRKRA